MNNENDRERAKAAFLSHTPLNEKLAPLLDVCIQVIPFNGRHLIIMQKFYKVSLESLLPPKAEPASLHHLLRNITPKELAKQDAATWEMLSRDFPELFLAKLEEVMGLTKLEEIYAAGGISALPAHFPVQRALFEQEERLPLTHAAPAISHASPAHHAHAHASHDSPANHTTIPRKAAVFETMVKLYYHLKPHLLCFFVQLVARLFERISSSSPHHRNSWTETTTPKAPEFSTRALLALPPLPDGDISDAHLTCRFDVSYCTRNSLFVTLIVIRYCMPVGI